MENSPENPHIHIYDLGSQCDLLNNIDEDNKNVSKSLTKSFDDCVDDLNSGKAKETMKVYLRVRPTINQSTITHQGTHDIAMKAPENSKRAQYTKQEFRQYAFTKVFGPQVEQDCLFNEAILPLCHKMSSSNDNCALIAYGMTNSGKTHTIQGSNTNPGVLPRLIDNIVEEMKQRGDTSYAINLSMFEIYQDNIYDLLSAGKKREKLSLRDAHGKVEVVKLSNHSVKLPSEAMKLMDAAAAKRTKSATLLNTGSSRSHAVYTVTLNRMVNGAWSSSAFQLIDLAGAERGKRTEASAAQQKEANNINTSLMQLWRCLGAIKKQASSSGTNLNATQEMIPFRESKLTHVLMPILSRAGVNGLAMVACINPQVDDYDETLTILQNASLANAIKEITDVGRVAASQQRPVEEKVTAPTCSSKGINLKAMISTSERFGGTATAANKKRVRQQESIASVCAPAVATGKRDSTVSVAMAAAKKTAKGKGSVKVVASVPSPPSHVLASTIEDANFSLGDEQDADNSAQKRRRIDPDSDDVLAQVAELGIDLHPFLFRMEMRVREETASEMAEAITRLHQQVDTLKAEMRTMEHSRSNDLTKSCKKAKRLQLDAMEQRRQSDARLGLQDLEIEMSDREDKHQAEIANLQNIIDSLTAQNMQLRQENADLIQRQTAVQVEQKTQKPAVSTASINNQENSTASEFSKRFKKSDDNIVVVAGKPSAIEKTKSPVRLPLSPLSNNAPSVNNNNSPIAKHSVAGLISVFSSNNNKPTFAVKKVPGDQLSSSPHRLRVGEEAPVGRVTRTRAQQIR